MRVVVIEGVAVADNTRGGIEPGDGQRAAQRRGNGLRETGGDTVSDNGDAAHGQRGDTVQSSDRESTALSQRGSIRRTAGAEVFLENGEFSTVYVQAVDDHRIVVVVDLQNQIRGAGVAVGIGDGVGEGLGAVATAMQVLEVRVVRVDGVGIGTIGIQHQSAVSSGEGSGGDRAGRHTVGTLDVVGQDVPGQREIGFRSGTGVAVVHGFWHVVDDVHIQRSVRGGAVVIDDGDSELLAQGVGAVGRRMSVVVVQGVAVTHHAGRGVKPGDGQCAAQWRGHRLREACGYTVSDNGDAAHGQGRYAIQRSDGEGATLSERSSIRCTAGTEVFLENSEFTAVNVEAADNHRIVVVVDLQHEVRGAGIAVGIRNGVGEGLGAVAAAMQVLEVGVIRVDGVGIGTIGIQHQSAVSPSEGSGGDRTSRHTVSTLDVVGQDVPGQREIGFRRRASVAVVHGFWHVINDVYIQRSVSGGAVVIHHSDRELLTQGVGAVGGRVRVVVIEGVAVTDNAGGGIEPGDGQCAAQRRGHRLREASGYTAGDNGDAAHGQRGDTVQSSDGESTALSQRGSIRRTAGAQIFLEDCEFTTFYVQAVDDHRIVVVVDLQNEVCSAGVTIGIAKGVGKGFCPVAAAMQRLEIRVAGVERVGVSAVGVQHQGAVSPGERTGDHRAAVRADRNAVGALDVVGQDVAGQAQVGFRSGAGVAVIHCFGHIIGDVHIQ